MDRGRGGGGGEGGGAVRFVMWGEKLCVYRDAAGSHGRSNYEIGGMLTF